MVTKNALIKLTAIGLVAIMGILGCAASQSTLLKEATVTQHQAEKIALDKVPQGQIKESELEQKKGKLVWSIEVVVPGTEKETKFKIDAKTGEILSFKQEDEK